MPSNPLTVPACRHCQSQWDKETAYFRGITVLQADPAVHSGAARLLEGPIQRRVKTSKREYQDLTKGCRKAWKPCDVSGLLLPGVKVTVDVDRYLLTPEKIVRGLFYFKSNQPLQRDYAVAIYPGNGFWSHPDFVFLEEAMHGWQGLGDDVFLFRSCRDNSDHSLTGWLLAFFKQIVLFAMTVPSEE